MYLFQCIFLKIPIEIQGVNELIYNPKNVK